MSEENGQEELYKKHRPRRLSELVGQDEAVAMLKSMRGNVPHFLLLTGPSGCGKTTIARILQRLLKCSDADFSEKNCADFRGIDMVRETRERMGFRPMGGESRIWLIDEAHQLTGDAQEALLKMLEDTPAHVWFMLATTNPEKLKTTIKTRATEVKVRLLKPADMKRLLCSVAAKEEFALSDAVCEKIVEAAEGMARKALVLLNQVIRLGTEEEQLGAIAAGVSSSKAIDVARAIFDKNPQWPKVAKLLKEIEDEPETVRRVVLGYCTSVILGGGNLAERAFSLITIFERNWFDSGKASMAACCWEAVKGK